MPSTAFGEDKRDVIGVLCDGPSLHVFGLLTQGEDRDLLSRIGVVALALPGPGCVPPKPEDSLDLPVHASWREMLAAHPDLNVVVDLTGRPDLAAELRRDLPPEVVFLERRAARLILRLRNQDVAAVACRVDLLHTQALLKAIIDQLKECILFLDMEGRVVDANKAVVSITGLAKEAIKGRPHRAVLGCEENMCEGLGDDCPFERVKATAAHAEATYSQVDEGGRMRYFRMHAYPIFDQGGAMTNVVIMRRDITQRTHMEQRLQQSEKLAAIGELSTYIAHEIRNPLFAISGFANSLLRDETLGEKSREKVGIILEESKRLDKILKSILNFSRPTQAKAGVVDLNQVVRSTMELMGIGCEKQGVRVALDLPADLAKAKADSELIKQCLINLVKNSMEAMPDGGVLFLRTGVSRGRLFLEVEDTGCGIPPEVRDKLFNPFFSTKGKGSGLGLAMTKKILDDIGGEVDLQSRPGEGTKVILFIPPLLAVAKDEAEG